LLKLVLKQLKYDKVNTFITIIALASSIAVIIVLQSFEQGQYEQLRRIVMNRGSDLVALQPEVKNFITTRSTIPQMARIQIEEVAGVKQAHPLTTLPAIYKNSGAQTPIYIIVFDSSGGPYKLLKGKAENRDRNIVIDYSLAKQFNLKIGDKFTISNFDFLITGITAESAFMMPFAFINYDGMIDLFLESEIAPDLSTFPLLSFLLIDVDPAFPIHEVQKSLQENVPGIDVLTVSELADNDVELGKGFYKPIIGLLISVGFSLGLLLISLLMYSSATRSQRDFAVLRALGFRTTSLMHYTIYLSVILLTCAFILGIVLAFALANLIEFARPIYYFAIFNASVLLKVGIMVIIFSVPGSILPFLKLKNCDPITALQSSAG